MVLCKHNVLQTQGERFDRLKSSHWNVTNNLRMGIQNIGQQATGTHVHITYKYIQRTDLSKLLVPAQTNVHRLTQAKMIHTCVLNLKRKSRRKHNPPTARKCRTCQWNKPGCLDARLLGRVQSRAFITHTTEGHMTYQNDPKWSKICTILSQQSNNVAPSSTDGSASPHSSLRRPVSLLIAVLLIKPV